MVALRTEKASRYVFFELNGSFLDDGDEILVVGILVNIESKWKMTPLVKRGVCFLNFFLQIGRGVGG